MPFLTLFSAPKPFTDPHINIIQRNAIQSWIRLPDTEVFLVGEEDGLAEAAADYGVRHLPDVRRNEWGTPLVSSIFDLARRASNSPLMCYVNGDILLLPAFVESIRKAADRTPKFLMVGQRWDLDLPQPLDFSAGWDARLWADAQTRGGLHAPAGSDYFIFPRSLFAGMPDFAIGRAGWDNWMIYHARASRWPLIDATHDLTVIHQSHDYSHLPGGKAHYDLEETAINAQLGGGMRNMYLTIDATHELVNGQVRRARPTRVRMLRALERLFYPESETGWRWRLTRRLRHLRRNL